MPWKVTSATGEEQTWYSAEEVADLKEDVRLAERIIPILLNELGLSMYDWREDQNEIKQELAIMSLEEDED
jgi:hypothetical protein